MNTFEWVREDLTIVYLDGKRIGKIIRTDLGFQYIPKATGYFIGEPFFTLEECKQSLEMDGEDEY